LTFHRALPQGSALFLFLMEKNLQKSEKNTEKYKEKFEIMTEL